MLTKRRRRNWKRLALLRGAEIRGLKKHRVRNRGLHKGIVVLLNLLRAVDKQSTNGSGWEEYGKQQVRQYHS